jgi:hypothetical protein
MLDASNNEDIRLSAQGSSWINAGNVGIGTTSPSYKLDVNEGGLRSIRSSAGWAGWFENTGNSSGVVVTAGVDSGDAPLLIRKQDGTELFSVRGDGTSWFNNGNVGIGTTSPGSKFVVYNNGGTGSTFYVDAGNSNSVQTLFEHTGSNTPVPFAISKSGYSGNSESFGILYLDMAHNVAGGGANLHFTLRDSNSNVTEYAGLGATIVTNTDGSEAGRLNFYTTNGGSTRLNRMVILPNGNVGVGTTGPGYKLTVSGETYSSSRFVTMTGELLSVYQDNWTNGASHYIIYNAWRSSIGDYLLVKSAGNQANSNGAIVISDGNGGKVYFGLHANNSPANDNSTAPLDSTYGWIGASTTYFSSSVGIGETSIDAKLHLTTATAGLINQKFESAGSAAWRIGIPASQTYFAFDNSADALTSPKMVIDSSGNLGVGTTAPAYKIDVSGGAIAIRGNAAGNSLRFDDSAGTSRNAFYVDTSNYLNIGNANYAGVKFVQTASAPTSAEFQGNGIQNAIGGTDNGTVLAEPAAWLAVRVGTTDYAIPMYTTG